MVSKQHYQHKKLKGKLKHQYEVFTLDIQLINWLYKYTITSPTPLRLTNELQQEMNTNLKCKSSFPIFTVQNLSQLAILHNYDNHLNYDTS